MQSWSFQRLARDRSEHPAWRAVLQISAGNVARLMRRGLSISSNNLLLGGERVFLNSQKYDPLPLPPGTSINDMLRRTFASRWGWDFHGSRWPHVHNYDLKDQTRDAEWQGRLMIFGKDPSTVIDFDVKSLDIDSMIWGWARNREGDTVFDTGSGPKSSFNLVFPGLLTWTTWPGDQRPQQGGAVFDIEPMGSFNRRCPSSSPQTSGLEDPSLPRPGEAVSDTPSGSTTSSNFVSSGLSRRSPCLYEQRLPSVCQHLDSACTSRGYAEAVEEEEESGVYLTLE